MEKYDEYIKNIFGITNFYDEIHIPIMEEIKNNKKKYSYLKNEIYEEILKNGDKKLANKIFWIETLQRIYIACITGYLRQDSWIKGICDSYYLNNYYSFVANMRGYMESSCDLYYSLEGIPMFLAKNYNYIYSSIKGELETICISSEVEKALLHFQEARKIKGTENVSEQYLHAKAMKKYMEHSHLKDLNLYEIYSELCEITHPAQASVYTCIEEEKNQYSFEIDFKKNISKFILNYSKKFGDLFMDTDNLLLVLLKELKYFDNLYSTNALENINLTGIRLWRKIEKEINKYKKN
ncbi:MULTISPECIES: hypothetical protein [Clostridium]|uniref:hypothetical protein n=1 Tax=Clostridium TaxID=1485 RepID=UPI00290356A3|nr:MULTISPECIES: hypothetical protein [Clostridium]MDU1229888.1 hypothetical protein [Clostridium sp.]